MTTLTPGDTTAPPRRPAPPAGDGMWLKLLGAAGGLTALFFLFGAAAIWMRLRLLGLPADEGLAVIPRQQIVTLSIRGMFLGDVIGVGVLVLLFDVQRRVAPAGAGLVPMPLLFLGAVFVAADAAVNGGNDLALIAFGPLILATGIDVLSTRAARRDDHARARQLERWARGLYVVALVYAAVWVSWLMLGAVVAIGIAEVVGATALARRLAARPWKGWAAGGIVLAVLVGGMLSQVGERLPLNQANLTPQPPAPNDYTDFPVLGESDGYLYVVQRTPFHRYGKEILALKRSDYDVAYAEQGTLDVGHNTPAIWINDELHRHLPDVWRRFTGQPGK